MILDDINKFYEKQNFDYLLKEFRKKNTIIIATCRSDQEHRVLTNKMGSEIRLFGEPINIPKITGAKAMEILGNAIPESFDGNIGSLFMPLDTMHERFNNCGSEEKEILRSLKKLYLAGIYEEREVFSLGRLKIVAKDNGLVKQDYEWTGLIDSLKSNGFMEINNGLIKTEEAYMELVVTGVADDKLINSKNMLRVFSSDPKALFGIGNRAWLVGLIDARRAEFMKVAIKAYEEALKVWTLKNSPMDYAMTQNNLGAAYRTLSEVEDKAENCRRAITAFNEALRVRTFENSPMDYATTQNNLGAAYRTLAEVEEKAENCRRAIKAYEEALKVFNEREHPEIYKVVSGNLHSVLKFCQ